MNPINNKIQAFNEAITTSFANKKVVNEDIITAQVVTNRLREAFADDQTQTTALTNFFHWVNNERSRGYLTSADGTRITNAVNSAFFETQDNDTATAAGIKRPRE